MMNQNNISTGLVSQAVSLAHTAEGPEDELKYCCLAERV